jgi:hypothetical protein
MAVYVNAVLQLLPFNMIPDSGNVVIMPILAQRLLINIRKVDYMGSEPVASKLLFAPPAPGSEDHEDDLDFFEMAPERFGLRHRDRGVSAETSGVRGTGVGSDNA